VHVETSIYETFIVEEISTFTLYYFELYLRTRIKYITRNDDVGELPSRANLSILLKTFQHLPRIILSFTYKQESTVLLIYYKWWFWWTTFECKFVNIIEEISTFTSYYFELHLRARINCITRNNGAVKLPSSTNLSIFCHFIRPLSKKPVRRRYLTDIEFKQTHIYMIFNYDEFRPFVQ
jgi:hypothetical protein